MYFYTPNQVALTYIVALDTFEQVCNGTANILCEKAKRPFVEMCIRKDKETCC